MFIFESYSLDAVKAQKLSWLPINVPSFKKSSKRFLFANWFMLSLRSWQNVADSLRPRSSDDLPVFRFMLFFVQITMSSKAEAGEKVIVVETSFALIAWYISFAFVATLIFFFSVCLLRHWESNALWIPLQNPHRHFDVFFWWKHFADRCFCAQCAQHCLFLQTYVQWSYFWHFVHCLTLQFFS